MAGPLGEADVNQYGTQQLTDEAVVLNTSTDLIWMRQAYISDSALIAANETKGAIEASPTSTAIPAEGEWVKLNEVTALAELSASHEWGYLVWAGRNRLDIPGSVGVTILTGPCYVAETTNFNPTLVSTATFGTRLQITAAGNTNYLDTWASGHVVAIYEGYVVRNGTTYIRFRSI